MASQGQRLALLAAGAIDAGVTVITAPARWTASGLRWYARRDVETPADRDEEPGEPPADES